MRTKIVLSISSGVALLLATLSIFLFLSGKTNSHNIKNIISEDTLNLEKEKAQSVPVQPSFSFVEIVKKVKPAVVRVESTIEIKRSVFDFWGEDDFFRRFFGIPEERQRTTGIASGFIISPDGYILTNNHVVEDAVSVKITTLQGKGYEAKIIGTDKRSDVAFLKINGKELPYVNLGDSSKVEVGEWVIAIGNPLGDILQGDVTVSAGIVSAKGRQLGIADFEDFIQTDAAINKGNSGGPLVNVKGEVIGMTSAILSPSGGNIGIGFAVPSNMAKFVVEQLKKNGRVIRGYLGVSIARITEETAKVLNLPSMKGALIGSVERGGPADKAGFKRYDVVIEFDGKKIEHWTQLKALIGQTEPGKDVFVKVIRDGKEITLRVTVGELEEDNTTARYGRRDEEGAGDLGIEVDTISAREAREYGYPRAGVVITRVIRGSVAYEAGLRRGDMILEINRRPVRNTEEFGRILSRLKAGDSVLFLIWRDEQELMFSLRLP